MPSIDFDGLAQEARKNGRRAASGRHANLNDVAALVASLAKVEQLATALNKQERTQERT